MDDIKIHDFIHSHTKKRLFFANGWFILKLNIIKNKIFLYLYQCI